MPSDTKENYDRMMQDPVHQQYFEQQGWTQPNAITYRINKYGFRSDEFVDNESIMVALGCSFTLGTGLPVQDIWPTLVGRVLGLKVYNLAWGGNSADTCFRLAEYWLPQLQPKLVCMLTPPNTRLELLTDNTAHLKAEVFLPESKSLLFSSTDTYLKYWYANEENARLNSIKNKLAIEKMCNILGIKLLMYDSMTEMTRSREEVGYARDYMHAGPIGHRMLADKFIRDYCG
jgi:hypothetical protein